ncbi:mechanosensitive ion channel family protein [Salisaeta longa]|uniref:mechanosensitive ion channel family protein n=1 Tax=Salisaeta longa TaxID=503170 RepID=UPI0003B76893|nr:mechanosensitive ion channel domain-containing protein [Salisaeta longa]
MIESFLPSAAARSILLVLGAVAGSLLAHRAAAWLARRTLRQMPGTQTVRQALWRHLKMPSRLAAVLMGVYALHAARPLPLDLALVNGSLRVMAVLAGAWALIGILGILETLASDRHALNTADNLRARKILTQVRILRRIGSVIIGVLALAVVLLNYEPFRQLGTGILASAGILGIVVGVAAQRTLGNVIAGLQIAITQPIRVDDVVIAEGDFGWIEEITLTYVVVRVWDQRRIVVPITQFVEQPFQNWTRHTSDLLGTVFFHVDYTAPVEALRTALHDIVEQCPYYDGRVCRLHVTNATDRTLELRALVSARNASDLWELRCAVREGFVAHLQAEHPAALPKTRAVVDTDRPPVAAASDLSGS